MDSVQSSQLYLLLIVLHGVIFKPPPPPPNGTLSFVNLIGDSTGLCAKQLETSRSDGAMCVL